MKDRRSLQLFPRPKAVVDEGDTYSPPSSSCSRGNIDHGSVLGGGDGSRDEPISREKGR